MGDDGVPGPAVAEFYKQRATDGGLLITEATNISAYARGYYGAPGLFTPEQVEGWKSVTAAVHGKGGKIFNQLWHTVRWQPRKPFRIVFEAIEAILSSVDSNKVGIRLSPFGTAFGCTDSNPREIYDYVVNRLNDYDLAYLHMVEPRDMQQPAPDAPAGGVTSIYRKMYKGVMISASGYDGAEARKVVEDGTTDLVAFARDFISNPDLVERIRTGAELNPVDWQTVYLPLDVPYEKGYTDYPFLDKTSA
ncbi:putative 12-oxophytodienoate reductase [Phytophthora cinnamomi]|uniref:putative 12-oxophytodienoate reductase n=1 Tax=Phytophthora cinnamomi TaxID=4785 RepID=UPI00355A9F11|nr:putative 12-oxophytodienoate reductase [Phytophthora cinnamomi]